jgi:hypothetical protein
MKMTLEQLAAAFTNGKTHEPAKLTDKERIEVLEQALWLLLGGWDSPGIVIETSDPNEPKVALFCGKYAGIEMLEWNPHVEEGTRV